ncbi:hypothetical protein VTK56DRAFT_8150 [Thermocarpiscus australiensis]
MRVLLKFFEYILGRLLYRFRGYDRLCLFNSPAFLSLPKPSIRVTSPDCGESGARLSDKYAKFGGGRFPTLEWEPPSKELKVKEYLLVSEDPDAPFGKPNVHSIFLFIPPTVNTIGPADLEVVKEDAGVKTIRAGYRVGKNRRNTVYIPPRPPLGHGPHRYFFQLVALSEKLDPDKISPVPTKEEVQEAVKGKVAAWGMWEGVYEHRW